ncbi:MAG TPA: methionine--tRNA ligase subunit beta [Phycisphaerales bacterium]|nr:methionine--tRNA ligase subunit beta [Phycisphaerales bacterium]
MADPTPAPTPTPAPAAGPEAKPTITFDEFAKVDLRVAKILKCEPHPNADKLFKLQLDDGSGTPRQICAGIRQAYTPEQLVGKTIIIVANLAPRMLRGEESRGMLLAASDAPKDGGVERRVVVLTTLSDMPPGSIVS